MGRADIATLAAVSSGVRLCLHPLLHVEGSAYDSTTTYCRCYLIDGSFGHLSRYGVMVKVTLSRITYIQTLSNMLILLCANLSPDFPRRYPPMLSFALPLILLPFGRVSPL